MNDRTGTNKPSAKKRPPIAQGVRFNVLRRDKFTCRYCGKGSPDAVLHLDHVKPYSIGGEDTEENLVTACQDCNYGKGAKVEVAVPAIAGERAEKEGGGFCGLFGHSFHDDGDLNEQFYVSRRVSDRFYACQLFDWFMGYPSSVTIKSEDDLIKCVFYHSENAWNEGYQNISRRRDRLERKS